MMHGDEKYMHRKTCPDLSPTIGLKRGYVALPKEASEAVE